MAELILNEEERAALTWLELPDETVGKLTKAIACGLHQVAKEREKITAAAIALMLTGFAFDSNADNLVLGLEGTTFQNKPTGDWRVTVERITPP